MSERSEEEPQRLSEREFRRSPFDHFGELASRVAGQGAFFAACVLILVLWLASYPLISDKNSWQLIINTVTTIITFLLVALLQNSQRRSKLVSRRS